ncbi:MAG: hypothetical protein BWY90_01630 [Deltaproteobacteria bacterium ADurb.BinA014]|nr:MAG: hypothetical protein BWY90_01630 [Deltaproteobacteria bacterium ADurb.BinA014]
MTFSEFGMVFAKNKRMVGKERRSKFKSLIEHQLQSSIGEMILSPNNMSDSHEVIIDHCGKIISRRSTGTHDDEITYRFTIKFYLSFNYVFKFN